MLEKIDPYFARRLDTGRGHRVIKTIDISITAPLEAISNKELPNPNLEATIEDLGWSEKAVDNIMHAAENKKIKIESIDSGRIRIEFLPITELPDQLGHVAELEIVLKNLKNPTVFGSAESDRLTYLQTTDFAVEGYIDDESEGKSYGRVYINTGSLTNKRNVYLDPESLHITDYEYGYSYCIYGGLPIESISRVDVIRARKNEDRDYGININPDESSENHEKYMERQALRLRKYIENKMTA